MKKILGLFVTLFITLMFTSNVKANTSQATMDSDISGIVGEGGVSDAASSSWISTYNGFRVYIVNTKTGDLLGKPVDFAPNKIAFKTAKKHNNLKINTNPNEYKNLSGNTLETSSNNNYIEWNFNASFSGFTIPSLHYRNHEGLFATKLELFFENLIASRNMTDFITSNFYKNCTSETCISNLEQDINSAYSLSTGAACDDTKNEDCNPLYYFMVEPLLLYNILGENIAMTPAESSGHLTAANFGDWWQGKTLKFDVPEAKIIGGIPTEFDNMIDTPFCRSLVLDYIDEIIEVYNEKSSDFSELTAARAEYRDKCYVGNGVRYLRNQILNYDPVLIYHEKRHIIGTDKTTPKTFEPYNNGSLVKYSEENRTKTMDIKNGLGVGFFNLFTNLNICPPSSFTLGEIANGNLKDKCCPYIADYFDPRVGNSNYISDVYYKNNKCIVEQRSGTVSEFDVNNQADCNLTYVSKEIEKVSLNSCSVCHPLSPETYKEENLTGNNVCCDSQNVKDFLNDPLSIHVNKDDWKKEFDRVCNTPNPDPGSTCVYEVKGSYPDCETDTTGYISDITNWNCIFESTEKAPSNFVNHYLSLSSNSYCEIYCREDIKYDFPNGGFQVLAGNHFTVGSDYYSSSSFKPISMVNEVECQTKNGVDHNKFVSDWEAANKIVSDKWDLLKIEETKKESIEDSYIKDNSSSSCSCIYNTSNNTCCEKEKLVYSCPKDYSEVTIDGKVMCEIKKTLSSSPRLIDCPTGVEAGNKCSTCPPGSIWNSLESKCHFHCETEWHDGDMCNEPCDGTSVGGECISRIEATSSYVCEVENDKKYNLISARNLTYKNKTVWSGVPTWCSNDSEPTSYNINDAKQNYNIAVTRRDNLLKELNQCYDYNYDFSRFSPNIELNYEEDKYGNNNIALDYLINDSYSTDLLSGSIENVDRYNCVGNKPCTLIKNDVEYRAYDYLKHFGVRNVNYKLPEDYYKYVNKFTGESVQNKPNSTYITFNYGNLPIHFNRATGEYDIKVDYGSLGTNNKFNPFILSGSDGISKVPGVYECTYDVQNKILEEDKSSVLIDRFNGLNLIYRPIELTNPFPGSDGKGREPGSNWENFVVDIDPYIYQEKPLYVINLTPSDIGKIREYNKKTNYLDYDTLNCDSDGNNCISSFINEFIFEQIIEIDNCARDFSNKCTRN